MKRQVRDIGKQILRIREKGSFIQNVSLIFGGNVLNLLIQFGFAPIISRIYGPEAYGSYAYYNLIVSNIGFFAALSLPSIFVLPKTRFEFLALAKFTVFATIVLSVLAFVFFLFFEGVLFDYHGELIAIPLLFLLILFGAINSVTAAWNMRAKLFIRNSYSGVSSNLAARFSVLTIGNYWQPVGLGLIAGDLIRSIVVFFTQNAIKTKFIIFRFLLDSSNWKSIILVFRKNISVPKFIFPSQLLSKWSSDIPVLVIGGYYNKEMLGYYTFALAMLNIPKSLVVSAFQPVFFQKVNELFQSKDPKLPILLSQTFLVGLVVLLIPFTILSIYGEQLFSIVFGQEWSFSGRVMLVVCTEVILSTILAPFGGIRRIFGLERKILILTISSIGLKGLTLMSLMFIELEFLDFLLLYATSNSLFLLINQFDLLWSTVGRKRAVLVFTVSLICVLLSTLLIKLV